LVISISSDMLSPFNQIILAEYLMQSVMRVFR
jgi:hypothetical protein